MQKLRKPKGRKRNTNGQFESLYPFDELTDIGDFFIIPTKLRGVKLDRKYSNVRSSAYNYSRRAEVPLRFKCSCDAAEGKIKVIRVPIKQQGEVA